MYCAYVHLNEKHRMQQIQSARQMKQITWTMMHMPGKRHMLRKKTQAVGHINQTLIICGSSANSSWTGQQF